MKMKRLAISLVLLFCIICLSGCGKNAPKSASSTAAARPVVTEKNAEGGPLHTRGVNSQAGNYDFTNDLAGYLLEKVDKAREFVHGMGMSTLITGETEEVSGSGVCFLVFLGNDRDDQFVREIHYAISKDGMIYEYDPIFDIWDCVFFP